jgi:hypothetical protein
MKRTLTPNMIGERFDQRVIIGLAREGNTHRRRWLVRCDCGREFTCLTQDLRRGGPCRACTPRKHLPRLWRRKRPYEWRYNAAVNRARHSFEITYDEFYEFTKIGDCHYCGDRIEWGDPFAKDRPSGLNLDRKDSNLPYRAGNLVVACRRCNYGKNNFFSYEEWRQIGAVIRSWRQKDWVCEVGNSHPHTVVYCDCLLSEDPGEHL